MVRSYKWQPHDEQRHAIPQELAVNEAGRTLCGRPFCYPGAPRFRPRPASHAVAQCSRR
ncbi:zinc finger protein [Lentzea sp. DG1S-22]|uniref:zinc finger protein n=1 Tax=Lentzea sp. DG1S-22 TaxID=3108822 RepID=UPI003FA58897